MINRRRDVSLDWPLCSPAAMPEQPSETRPSTRVVAMRTVGYSLRWIHRAGKQGNNSDRVKDQTTEVAMGGGEEEFYEKKLSKDEKKALAKAKREEKRKAKLKAKGMLDEDDDGADDGVAKANKVLAEAMARKAEEGNEEVQRVNPAAEELASEGTICTYASSRKGVDARSRDVNVQNFTLQHKGNVMLDGTSVVLNHGNRYGLIGR